jgi:hypothetical protein
LRHLFGVKKHAYVLDESADRRAAVAVHREALLVLRPRLVTVEVDPTPDWPSKGRLGGGHRPCRLPMR